jgi:hypothetical protein
MTAFTNIQTGIPPYEARDDPLVEMRPVTRLPHVRLDRDNIPARGLRGYQPPQLMSAIACRPAHGQYIRHTSPASFRLSVRSVSHARRARPQRVEALPRALSAK